MLRRLTRPSRPPPKGLFRAKSMCFWLSTRTMNEGTFTTCLPTLLIGGVGWGGCRVSHGWKQGRRASGSVGAPDVALPDEDARVVDRLGQAQLVDQGLQAALKEALNAERQHVIQLVLGLVLVRRKAKEGARRRQTGLTATNGGHSRQAAFASCSLATWLLSSRRAAVAAPVSQACRRRAVAASRAQRAETLGYRVWASPSSAGGAWPGLGNSDAPAGRSGTCGAAGPRPRRCASGPSRPW